MRRLSVFMLLLVSLLTSASLSKGQTTDPPWVAPLDRIVPFAGHFIELLFKGATSDKLNKSVKIEDAQKKLDELAAQMQKAIQPVNDEVREITAWRYFMDELNGAGSLSEYGSFRSSILQIEAYASAGEWYSDNALDPALEKIDRICGAAGKQWELLWNRAQNQAMPAYVSSEVTVLRRNFTDLATSIPVVKRATTKQAKRLAMASIALNAHNTETSIGAIIAAWDAWHRDLGMAFTAYMKKFGAQPDKSTEMQSRSLASLDLEFQDAQHTLSKIDQHLASVSAKLKKLELFPAASPNPSAMYAGATTNTSPSFTSEQGNVAMWKVSAEGLTSTKSELEEQRRFQTTRMALAAKELQELRSRPILSAEDLSKLLAGEDDRH